MRSLHIALDTRTSRVHVSQKQRHQIVGLETCILFWLVCPSVKSTSFRFGILVTSIRLDIQGQVSPCISPKYTDLSWTVGPLSLNQRNGSSPAKSRPIVQLKGLYGVQSGSRRLPTQGVYG